MSKNTNLSFLTDFLTADIVNSRVGMNNVSPQSTFDVTGTGKFSGILTLGSTVSNGTYTYTLPSATGTLALTSDIPSVSGYVPYTGANQSVDLGNNVLTSRGLNIDSIGGTAGALNLRQATSFSTWSGAPFTSIYATTGNRVVFSFSNDNRTFTLDGSLVSAASPRTFTFPDATGTLALTSDIPSVVGVYLPLAGGTLTGALNGTTATFSQDSTFHGVTIGRGGGGTLQSFAYNTAIGSGALSANTTGIYNTAIGFNALANHTTGNSQVALGLNAGRYINSGANNVLSSSSIYIGVDTRASASGNTNEIVIGHNAIGNGSNTVTIGNSSITNNYFIGAATFSSSVGVGLSGTPVKTLEVRGTLAISNSSSSYWYMDRDDSDGRFKILTDTDNERLSILTGGNVGIGTASPAGKLEINGLTFVNNTGDSTARLLLRNSTTGASAGGLDIQEIGVDASLNNASNGYLSLSTNNTERMRITSAGDVGIGTNNPARKLDVNGFFRVSDGTVNTEIVNGGGVGFIGTASNHSLALQTNNTERMRITSGGNVLIGTTTDTGFKLDVNGSLRWGSTTNYLSSGYDSGGIYMELIGTTTLTRQFRLQGINNALNSYSSIRLEAGISEIAFVTKDIERMRITSVGKVGIGVVSPNYSLTVSGTIQCGYIALGDVLNNNNSTIEFVNGPNSTTYATTGNITYYGNTNLTLCYGGGNVLIGTLTNYGAKVHASHASSGYPVFSAINTSVANSRCYYGQKYSGSTDDYYMIFDNAVANKFLFYGNGGLGNVQANDVNLSDERVKKDIASLESYWDKFKAIEIVKFKYKDQTHDDFNIGVIAQQVEAVAPEFIEADGWGKNTPTQSEEPLKSVYTSDLYHASIKVLQEAMAKIEKLETEIDKLKNK